METHWLTEDTLLVRLGETIDDAVNARVHELAAALRKIGALEVIPAFASLAVRGLDEAGVLACAAAVTGVETPPVRVVELPVCYGGEFGPDLADVAAATGLTAQEVIQRHTAPIYRVHALGFSPGFAYLAGLHPVLALPRRATPRTRVEPGSVGVGGGQTGAYPSATPGGWHLLGRTGRRLFRPECAEQPSLLQPGDGVRFVAIPREEFHLEPGPMPTPSEGSVEVLRAGLLTTVQGGPRAGWAQVGVGLGGAMDPLGLATANLLLGNAATAAALEVTLLGPRLRFARAATVAVCGGEGALTIDGMPAPLHRPLAVAAGSMLDLGALRRGCRAILAFRGGVQVPEVLGSPSTDLAGGFGGLGGRALREGDRFELGEPSALSPVAGALSPTLRPALSAEPLRVLAGPEPAAGLIGRDFTVSPQSDRRGIRLLSESPLAAGSGAMISGPVRPGTIQLPPDGQPIALGVDAQTLGGYPRIAQVIAADLPRLAQLAPGARCRFVQVSLDAARAALRRQQRDLALLAAVVRLARH